MFALNTSATVVGGSLTTFLTDAGSGFFGGSSEVILTANPTVYLQVRVWDNVGGQLSSWDEARNAALAGSTKAVSWSKVFSQPLAFGASPPAGMVNFESFNIFIVPEPSIVVLVGLGSLCLLLFGRYNRQSGFTFGQNGPI
jgi:hypothetical protein